MTKQRQNEDERWAEQWLRKQGYKDVQRPRCDPPDFVVNNHYAVEVTRLNQRITVGDDKHSKGEEEAREPLRRCIENTISELGPPGNEGTSWIIDCEYDFTEYLPARKTVAAQIKAAIKPLLEPYDHNVVSAIHTRHHNYSKHAGEPYCMGFPHICLECGVCLDLLEFSDHSSKFILQNVSDGIGIHVAGELKKSIANRILDKSRKISNRDIIERYPTWWLLLVDHVCHIPVQSLSEHERSFVRDQPSNFWSRIVVISSRNLDWHYDLLRTGTDRGDISPQQ